MTLWIVSLKRTRLFESVDVRLNRTEVAEVAGKMTDAVITLLSIREIAPRPCGKNESRISDINILIIRIMVVFVGYLLVADLGSTNCDSKSRSRMF